MKIYPHYLLYHIPLLKTRDDCEAKVIEDPEASEGS